MTSVNNTLCLSGADASAQGALSLDVSPTAGLLRGPVPGEGSLPHRASHLQPAQVLAQGPQPQGGHVSQRVGGDPRRHRAGRVPEGGGAAVHSVDQVRLQSSLPGGGASPLLLEQ